MRKLTPLELISVPIIIIALLATFAVKTADNKTMDLLISVLNSEERLIWINVKLEGIADVKAEVWNRMQNQLDRDDKAMAKLKREHNNPDSQPAVWSRK